MISIGSLSKNTGVHVSTIRYYEKIGLLKTPERSQGQQRRYALNDVKDLSFIRHSRELGFSIDNIRQLLALSRHPEKPCHNIHSIAEQHLSKIRELIKKLQTLECELQHVDTCQKLNVAHCPMIEKLFDHSLCLSDTHEKINPHP